MRRRLGSSAVIIEMLIFDTFTLLLVLSAVFSYVNARWLKQPPTIAFMLGSLVLSITLLGLRGLGIEWASMAIDSLKAIDFSTTVLYGILSFLLFAGSLQLDIRDLAREKWVILTLATFGVIISTFVVGLLMYVVFDLLGAPLSLPYCLAFGALISPTDPVIVISLLKGSETSRPLRMKVMGEALFNDGVAIVAFTTLLAMTHVANDVSAGSVSGLLAQQLIGSTILGLVAGWVTHRLLSHVAQPGVQLFVTLGMVAGIYDLATALNTSGPIAIVILGLVANNYRGRKPIDEEVFNQTRHFWTWLDEFLNAALFVMMGLEMLTVRFQAWHFFAGAIAIGVVLLGRYISVWIPIRIFRFFRPFTKNAVFFLTWVGLRGGIPLALALSLPVSPASRVIVPMTYMVVIFSTFVQGLTFKRLIRHESEI